MTGELLLNEEKVTKVFMHIYQKKTDSILFAIIITRLDVTFAASRLARFNQNPRDSHHKVTDQVIQYLYISKSRALRYEDNFRAHLFIYASDALFANNMLD